MTAFPAHMTSAELRDLSAGLGHLIAAMDLLGLDRLPGLRVEPLAPEAGDRILAAVLAVLPETDPPHVDLEPADGRTWTVPAAGQEPSTDAPAPVEEGPAAEAGCHQSGGGDAPARGVKRCSWSPEADALLVRRRAEGASLKAIAEEMGRKASAVENRLYTLRTAERMRVPARPVVAQPVTEMPVPAPARAAASRAGALGDLAQPDAPLLPQEDWRGEGLIRGRRFHAGAASAGVRRAQAAT